MERTDARGGHTARVSNRCRRTRVDVNVGADIEGKQPEPLMRNNKGVVLQRHDSKPNVRFGGGLCRRRGRAMAMGMGGLGA
jgi:hypothetical protein